MSDYRQEAADRFPYLTGANDQRDHLAWAKRIMYREEHKDKTLTPIQVDFAKRAMNIDQTPKKP